MPVKAQDITLLVFEALPQAVVVINADGEVLCRNAAGRTMLPGGDSVEQVLSAETPSMLVWAELFSSLAETPGGLTLRNVHLAGRGSRRLLCDIYGAMLAKAAGGQTAMVVVEEVSARATMERRLAASERLSAGAALAEKVGHELNNPLDGVLRYIGLAERLCDAQAAEHLAKARVGLGRMAEVIRELTDEAGRSVALQPIDRLLDEAITVMKPRAQAVGVSVVCDIADDACAKVPGQLFQVFCNVTKNALDAMPAGGLLKIRLRREKNRCMVQFADTGGGLDETRAEAVFKPFYTTKPTGQGAGLGLAICREILARLGGTITIANRPEGGAIVTVSIPLPCRPGERKQEAENGRK